ncbi:hypothetical protein E4U43_003987 [Claviceps pusilla]|uniref:Uncharacterized protein n=1 Tax=Claviceps pusilla TaxID=123648 RepID=A0A9P7N401_9HYPO|nr:hypothetical protein E4U43_003987 [Claviceps pusilla]
MDVIWPVLDLSPCILSLFVEIFVHMGGRLRKQTGGRGHSHDGLAHHPPARKQAYAYKQSRNLSHQSANRDSHMAPFVPPNQSMTHDVRTVADVKIVGENKSKMPRGQMHGGVGNSGLLPGSIACTVRPDELDDALADARLAIVALRLRFGGADVALGTYLPILQAGQCAASSVMHPSPYFGNFIVMKQSPSVMFVHSLRDRKGVANISGP